MFKHFVFVFCLVVSFFGPILVSGVSFVQSDGIGLQNSSANPEFSKNENRKSKDEKRKKKNRTILKIVGCGAALTTLVSAGLVLGLRTKPVKGQPQTPHLQTQEVPHQTVYEGYNDSLPVPKKDNLDYVRISRALFCAAAFDSIGEYAFQSGSGARTQGLAWLEQTGLHKFTDDTIMAHFVFEAFQKHYTAPNNAFTEIAEKCAGLVDDKGALADAYKDHPYFGGTTRGSSFQIKQLLKAGKSWTERPGGFNQITGEKTCGSVMRVWPIGFFYSGDPVMAAYVADRQSSITHRHPSARAACAAIAAGFAVLCDKTAKGETDFSGVARAMIDAADKYNNEEMVYKGADCVKLEYNAFNNLVAVRARIKAGKVLTSDMLRYALTASIDSSSQPSDVLGGQNGLLGWNADENAAAVLYIFLRNEGNLQNALLEAINIEGGDRDSVATVVGAFSGYISKWDPFTLPGAANLERFQWLQDIGKQKA